MRSIPSSLKRSILLFIMLLSIAFNVTAQKLTPKKHVIIGYVGGYHGLVDTTMVNPDKLTHINYAFVNVQHNRAWLTNIKTDTINFKYLVGLKKRNPDLKVLISIGGWGWSGNFSDAAISDTSRSAFAASAVAIVKQYKLDGIDIDWEYPGQVGIGNVHRPEDKQNYTLMFRALRQSLDSLQQQTGNKLLLTAAVGAFRHFLQHTEMGKAQQYLDYINLMTYDYMQDSIGITVHHTNLYPSKKYVTENSVDKAVDDFIAAGVPVNKLVAGIAFYGRSIGVADGSTDGLGTKTTVHMRGGGYTYLKDSLINLNTSGFKYYRDKDAMAPYLFNAQLMQFISFDDEWSVKNKCRYAVKKGMAGVMFWEYAEDKKEYLLNEIDKDLK